LPLERKRDQPDNGNDRNCFAKFRNCLSRTCAPASGPHPHRAAAFASTQFPPVPQNPAKWRDLPSRWNPRCAQPHSPPQRNSTFRRAVDNAVPATHSSSRKILLPIKTKLSANFPPRAGNETTCSWECAVPPSRKFRPSRIPRRPSLRCAAEGRWFSALAPAASRAWHWNASRQRWRRMDCRSMDWCSRLAAAIAPESAAARGPRGAALAGPVRPARRRNVP